MTNQAIRGVMQGQTRVILECAAPFPDATRVEVRRLADGSSSSAVLLAAMAAEPHLTSEDVLELERAIAEGRRPGEPIDPFGQEMTEAREA